MTQSISAKFAALGVALMINGAMLGVTALLFNGQLHAQSLTSVAHVPVPEQSPAHASV